MRVMITALPPNERHINDDMSVEILLLATIGICAPFLAGIVGSPDMLAIPGAILAAVVALLKANSEKRSWSDKGIVVVGTSVVGSTAPSAAVYYFWQDAVNKVIPHIFMLAGFLSGLIGWSFCWGAILVLDRRREKIIEKELNKRLGLSDPDEPQP